MKTTVQQWGKSLALRIPRAFATRANIKKGTIIDLTLEKGRLAVTPVADEPLSLKKLLAKATPKNTHTESDWGAAVGREF